MIISADLSKMKPNVTVEGRLPELALAQVGRVARTLCPHVPAHCPGVAHASASCRLDRQHPRPAPPRGWLCLPQVNGTYEWQTDEINGKATWKQAGHPIYIYYHAKKQAWVRRGLVLHACACRRAAVVVGSPAHVRASARRVCHRRACARRAGGPT